MSNWRGDIKPVLITDCNGHTVVTLFEWEWDLVAKELESAALKEARREALEVLQRGIDIFNTLHREPLMTGDVWLVQHASKAWIEEARALMEKDAPERPTSDALDPAGLEAAIELFNSLDCPGEVAPRDLLPALIRTYLKAAKEVR